MSLRILRKELRAMGFKVKTESLSWGRHATFTDKDGIEYPSLFFNDEQRAKWQPLRDYLDSHLAELRGIKVAEGVYGLMV